MSNFSQKLSNTSFINDIWLVRDPYEIILKTIAFLPVVLWGIFGNATLLYVIIRNRHLRTPTNLLIGNMAIADLTCLLIFHEIFLIYDFFQNYQLGEFGCKVEGVIECSLLLASVMSLSAISYDRLTAIVLPKETRLTRNGAKIVIAITWVAGFVLASPLFFYRTYKERQWLDFVEKYCTEDMIVINIYWHIIITMLVWLPLAIILCCYIAIFVKLDRYEQTILRRDAPFQVNYKKKVARMMFIIVVTFMVCRLPFTVLIFYRNYLLKNQTISQNKSVQNQVNGVYKILWFTSKYLIFLNAAVNPMIYGMTNENFRKAFKTTFISKWLYMCETKKKSRCNGKCTKETEITPKSKIHLIFKDPKVGTYKPQGETTDSFCIDDIK